MSAIHKNYGIQFLNVIRDGKYYKTVEPINRNSESVVISMLYYIICLGPEYSMLNKAINKITEAIDSNTFYFEYYDFMEVTCENGVATICYDGGGDERIIPQQDYLNILLELREFVMQPPLHGQ